MKTLLLYSVLLAEPFLNIVSCGQPEFCIKCQLTDKCGEDVSSPNTACDLSAQDNSKTLAATSRNSGCEPGWTYFKPTNSCYFAVHGRFSFAEAFKGCQDLGANMVSIHSEEESDFVGDLVGDKKMHWLGLRLSPEGEWYWLDGTPFDYTRWRAGEPNGCCGEPSITYASANWAGGLNEWDDGHHNAYGVPTRPHDYVCKKVPK